MLIVGKEDRGRVFCVEKTTFFFITRPKKKKTEKSFFSICFGIAIINLFLEFVIFRIR